MSIQIIIRMTAHYFLVKNDSTYFNLFSGFFSNFANATFPLPVTRLLFISVDITSLRLRTTVSDIPTPIKLKLLGALSNNTRSLLSPTHQSLQQSNDFAQPTVEHHATTQKSRFSKNNSHLTHRYQQKAS